MRKRFKTKKIEKYPATNKTPEELWIMLDESMIPNISPMYYISNYGRVYSLYSNRLLTLYTNSNGYPEIHLVRNDKSIVHVPIHQAVCKAFFPIDDNNGMIPNHINAQKEQSYQWNLEWVTHLENSRHARSMGLILSMEDSTNVKITRPQAIEICNLLETGLYRDHRILELMNLDNYVSRDTVAHIRRGECWIDISVDYKFLYRQIYREFGQFQYYKIIEIIHNDISVSNYKIMELVGINIMDLYPEKRQRIYNLIEKIKHDIAFVISNQ